MCRVNKTVHNVVTARAARNKRITCSTNWFNTAFDRYSAFVIVVVGRITRRKKSRRLRFLLAFVYTGVVDTLQRRKERKREERHTGRSHNWRAREPRRTTSLIIWPSRGSCFFSRSASCETPSPHESNDDTYDGGIQDHYCLLSATLINIRMEI